MNEVMIEYVPTLTTFVDILGYRELIRQKDPACIHGLLHKFRKHYTPNEKSKAMFEVDAIAFSDSIVRSIPLLSEANKRHPTGLLYYELLDLAWIQGCLVYEDGVFLRGAITDGDLFLDGGIVFGPALVDAYVMESQHAKYPRILVNDSVIELLKTHHHLLGSWQHDFETDLNYVNGLTCIDFDGKRFIDYLGVSEWESDEFYVTMLGQHCDEIAKAAREIYEQIEAEESPERLKKLHEVLSKYHWAASYHNAIVGRYDEELFCQFDGTKESYLLTEASVPLLSQWEHAPPTKQ